MRCEPCQGTGKANNRHYIMELPCPICMGTGIAYCCDDAGVNPPNVGEQETCTKTDSK